MQCRPHPSYVAFGIPRALISRVCVPATGFTQRPESYANLVYLHLGLFPWRCVFPVTLRLLAQIPRFPSLAVLTIEPDPAPLTGLRDTIWHAGKLPAALARASPAMSTLKKVEVRLPYAGETFRAAEREHILRVLAALDAKGILAVV